MDKWLEEMLALTDMGLRLREVSTKKEWCHFHRIRKCELYDTFMKNTPYDPKHPSFFKINAEHYVFYKGQKIIGTVSTDRLDENRAALRYVAIDKGFKNMGFGSIMLSKIEEILKMQGYQVILLHATPQAYSFYARNGYVKIEFDEGSHINSEWVDMGKVVK